MLSVLHPVLLRSNSTISSSTLSMSLRIVSTAFNFGFPPLPAPARLPPDAAAAPACCRCRCSSLYESTCACCASACFASSLLPLLRTRACLYAVSSRITLVLLRTPATRKRSWSPRSRPLCSSLWKRTGTSESRAMASLSSAKVLSSFTVTLFITMPCAYLTLINLSIFVLSTLFPPPLKQRVTIHASNVSSRSVLFLVQAHLPSFHRCHSSLLKRSRSRSFSPSPTLSLTVPPDDAPTSISMELEIRCVTNTNGQN